MKDKDNITKTIYNFYTQYPASNHKLPGVLVNRTKGMKTREKIEDNSNSPSGDLGFAVIRQTIQIAVINI